MRFYTGLPPAVAQFFQPLQEACTDSGITMEVAAVRVEGDTAQAYILSAGPVDATTDLGLTVGPSTCPLTRPAAASGWPGDRPPDSHFSLHCENHGICPPIPTGGKMTFSVRQLLTGKKAMEA